MVSDTNNYRARLFGSFEFDHQHFLHVLLVCEPFTFNLGLNSHILWIPILTYVTLETLDTKSLRDKMAHCFSFRRVCVTGTSSEACLDVLAHQLQTFSSEPLFFFLKAALTSFCAIFLIQ